MKMRIVTMMMILQKRKRRYRKREREGGREGGMLCLLFYSPFIRSLTKELKWTLIWDSQCMLTLGGTTT